ncbi:MAG: universal stress protein [Thermoproteota archaeon]|nr:universal stress protein [Thermoproteota archaeon]
MSETLYKKILVPYDDSEPSNKALDHAVNIAKMSGNSEVILLYVIAEFPTYHFIERPARSIKTGEKITLSQFLKEVYELMEVSANDVLNKKKEEIKKTMGVEIRTKLLTGHISNTIIDFAAKEKVDLIVIGNVGRSGISKIKMLGSVSRSVSEKAACPVMIIH